MKGKGPFVSMKRFLFLPMAAAALATFAAGQSLTPTAKAQSLPSVPLYQVRVDWQKAEPGVGGLVIRGRVTNTGHKPLTYTQVIPILLDSSGKEVLRCSGYLTVSPLRPGQSAEFRACEFAAPPFARLRMVFRESGIPVVLEAKSVPLVAHS